MTPIHIQADSVAPQAWRNGGGQTRELLSWPPGKDWQLRISRADIATDGPFSAYPDVERWFAVLEGEGVALRWGDVETPVRNGDAPLCFDGGAAPGCRLLQGATQDLNLMARSGRGHMQLVQAAPQNWLATFTVCGLYTCTPGTWSDETMTLHLAAHTLLWQSFTQAAPTQVRQWSFATDQANAQPRAWWLGYSPMDTAPGNAV